MHGLIVGCHHENYDTITLVGVAHYSSLHADFNCHDPLHRFQMIIDCSYFPYTLPYFFDDSNYAQGSIIRPRPRGDGQRDRGEIVFPGSAFE
jgi:hypothetical protein